jgi:hypothetical protein
MIGSGKAPADPVVLLFKLVVLLAMLLWFVSRFRGGRPPNPMHPLPGDDSALPGKKQGSKRGLEFPGIF